MSSRLKYLVFDIETIVDAGLVQRIYYPQESISSQEALIKRKHELEAQGKSDFIPATFHLPVSLAFAGVNEKFELIGVTTLDRPDFRPQHIVKQFWNIWQSRQQPTLVTYNGRGFDLPVLEQAAFRYGISVPNWFNQQGPSYTQSRNRYNSESHFDLMDFMSNFGASRQEGGLNLNAALLGKPGKLDVDGSMVQDLWDQGESLRIDDYCVCDALDTYFVFLRTRVMLGQITLEREFEIVSEAQAFLEHQIPNFPILEEYLKNFQSWKPLSEDQEGFFSDFTQR